MKERISQYRFDKYTLLPAKRLLMLEGQAIPLKSKVFETLLCLVRHHGQLIAKEDLMNEIWGESFVEEGNLTQNIFMLRKILGENPSDHRFIVTVPGRGYRFVAKVQESVESHTGNSNGNGHSTNGNAKLLAVLPLKMLVPEENGKKEYLGLAIADSLITRINAGRSGSTYPTEAILKYVGTEKDAVSIGRELSAETVLSGTIQTSGDMTRTNLQLHNAVSGELLWTRKLDVEAKDFFELQDQISEQAAEALSLQMNEGNSLRSTLKNPEVYQTYIKYRFFWETRTESGLLTSLNGAREMIEAEPDFPLGYVALADSYLLLGHHLFLPPKVVYPSVREAVDRAFELSPDLAEAYATRADYCFITKDWAEAENMYLRAIRLKPDYAGARHWYGWFLMAMGRFDESLVLVEQAQMLDPSSLYLGMVRGVPLFYQKQYERAIDQFNLILEIEPNYNRARYYLAQALLHSGRQAEAIDEFEKVVAAEPIQQTMGLLGHCYGVAGKHSKAREILKRLDRIERDKYVSPYTRAHVHAGLGETERALDLLERAFEENSIWLVWLNVDMQFEDLRGEPRFKSLVERLDFPQL